MTTVSGTGRRRERLPAEQRRGEILAAAATLFRSRHYAEVSLDEVAERAGVTRGLINHHFGTKRDLYIAVVRRVVDVDLFPVPAYVHGATLRERLEESLDGYLDVIERHRDLWLDSVHARGMGDPEVLAVVEEAREKAARRICAVMGLGRPDDLAPERMALFRVWEGLAEAAVLQWLQDARLTREQVRALILDTFEDGAMRLLAESSA